MVARNSIIHADNLDVLRELPDRCINLVYIDPPFGTGSVQQIASTAFQVVEGYNDLLVGNEYLANLRTRLEEIHRVLTDNGSLYLHLDYRYVHYVRLILDSIFGADCFLNEIIWAYDYGGRSRDRWPKKHDNILWYSKSKIWIFNYEEIERIPYMAPGLVGPEKAARGKLPTDTWWMTIVPTMGTERTGYPNQKPEKLLERIVTASSRVGDLVADFYCGSGTTGVVAKKLGRDYLLVDNNPIAIQITNKRLGLVKHATN